ncbi:hypothetical protein G6F70_007334 [Rhizopus microsporus]|uniref:CAP-Gly domain-containing protein n=1 Tax=Rhizopus microsporus TaxID=58291 RepID=A0A1X0SFW3_RHIZD|nr:hypothetical protein G6F71_002027 [Rhizopus microsporus]KAG1196572.1 hypothetical protein G6F70_007334 [Rhizopus microsporus]KAG1208299.1 hypothetical protein G6F69_007331 [Rhizopus microsporus]KAG1229657.1 hypothetical protein G6F67_006990 [Rhizopus microsporus]KAG1261654.1 hypothetical protein G6F68_006539 [Rhizopus microsporus]
MFDTPPGTLHDSLNKLFNHPKEYLADVCFYFPSTEIWAHRAIILARAPKSFIERYLPEILDGTHLPLKLDISHVIRQTSFTSLLRFWYTASFVSPDLNDTSELIRNELEALSIRLGTPLLPLHSDAVPDSVQLVSDLKRMLHEDMATDVTIHIVSSSDEAKKPDTVVILSTSPDNHTYPVDIHIASFKAHKFLLAVQSSYFYSLFCTQFQEASSSVVHLTDDLFNAAIVDTLLHFFYTDKVTVSPLPSDPSKSALQHRLLQKKHALRVIQKTFYAADYLGHNETLGKALLYEMQELCHQFKCVCHECAVLLPSMLAWSDKHAEGLPKLKQALVLLYSDPVHSLPSLWSQRPFSFLIASLVPSAATVGENMLQAMLKQDSFLHSRKQRTIIHDIEARTFSNVTKHNAIHVLHSLHLCFSHIRCADPSPSWSRPALDLIYPILHYAVSMVSQFFDFYCVEYPILLSCVDGIGAGFSVDFLDFLLSHVLTEGIQETNAGVIYQGIVRYLIARQEVVKNMAIDDVLLKARKRCAAYIAQRWAKVKAQGGFMKLEKATLRQLSEDTNVPYRALSKPYDSDFATIFSFKPRKFKKSSYIRRLSMVSTDRVRSPTRPRAFSAECALGDAQLHLLETETSNRLSTTSSLLEQQRPMLRTSSSFTSLTDQLLPLDPLPPPPRLEERPSRLKFELPVTPARSRSPSKPTLTAKMAKGGHTGKGRRPRWSIGSSDISDDDEADNNVLGIGDKIKLLNRPLPTLGTIKYIGPVEFAEGPYIGVELESRLGKSDGSVDGVRYFYTDPQRALFVRPSDLEILYHQK